MTSRRRFLGFVGTATIPWLWPRNGRAALRRTLDYDDPEDALTAMVKMRGSLLPEDVPHWYAGTIYAVLPGRSPLPLVGFEGSEIDYYERQPDGSYHAWAATVSIFRDLASGQRLDSFTNPLTGIRSEVRANSISVKAHYIYSIHGFKRSDDPRPLPAEPRIQKLLTWRESGEHVWLSMRRAYPPGATRGEHQLVRGALAELQDPDQPKVHTTSAPTYVSPYLTWFGMGELGGHALWVGPARKLDRVQQYPRELLDYLERHFPDKLSARPRRPA